MQTKSQQKCSFLTENINVKSYHHIPSDFYQKQNKKIQEQDDKYYKNINKNNKIFNKNQNQIQNYLNKYHQKTQLGSKNCLELFFFTWISMLIQYGSRYIIQLKDIPQLPQRLKVKPIYQKLSKNFISTQRSSFVGFTLIKAIFKTFKIQIFLVYFITIIELLTLVFSPILTNWLIIFLQSQNKYAKQASFQIWKSLQFFIAVSLLLVIKQFSNCHLWYNYCVLAYNIANSLTLMMQAKMLKYPYLCTKKYGTSDIINLNENDIIRIRWLGYNITQVVTTPIQIIVGSYIVYSYIGIAFIPSLIFICIMITVTILLSAMIQKENLNLIKKRDQRMKVTEQIFNFIRFIKINSYQTYFQKKLDEKRQKQIKANNKKNFLCCFLELMSWITNSVILCITFATYLIIEKQLTTAQAFTIIVLFKTIQHGIIQFPISFSEIILALQCIKRIQILLHEEDIDKSKVIQMIQKQEQNKNIQIGAENKKNFLQNHNKRQGIQSNLAVKIINGNYYWDVIQTIKKQQQTKKQASNQTLQNFSSTYKMKVLHDINIFFKKQKLTMIIGDIGSGKSSLLYAILNQIKCYQNQDNTSKKYYNSHIKAGQSQVIVNGSIAFSSQKPWIMSTTIKDNIILSKQFNRQKFQQVIYYSCLKEDLCIEKLPKQQNTQIGQKGVTLSGGQKVRIQLARALYSQNQILLLDDILSSVDVQVGSFLINECLLKYVKKCRQTVIMPTHAVRYLQYADQIIVMKKGRIVAKGSFQLLKSNIQLLQAIDHQNQKQKALKKDNQKFQKKQKDSLHHNKLNLNLNICQKNLQEKQKQSLINQELSIQNDQLINQPFIQSLLLQDTSQKGKVRRQTFKIFLKLSGGFKFIFFIMLFQALWTGLSAMSNIIIQKWCQNVNTEEENDSSKSTKYYLIYFILASIISSLCILFMGFVQITQNQLFSSTVHKKIIKSLLNASLNNFFNRVPKGRIMSRLSKDIGSVDQQIVEIFTRTLMLFFALVANIIMSIYASTVFVIIPLISVSYFTYQLKNYYMKTSIQLTRIQSLSNSEILDNVLAATNGLVSIRAYKLEQFFIQKQIKKLQQNKKARIVYQAVQNWFAMKVCLWSLLFNLPIFAYGIFINREHPSSIGIIMIYCLNLSQSIIDVIQNTAKIQSSMVAIQRVSQFINLQSELQIIQSDKKRRQKEQKQKQLRVQEKKQIYFSKQTSQYKAQNAICFQNVCLKYFQHHPLILENLTFSIKKNQKIGIIGRTGSGKSTIFNSLLKLINHTSGKIFINNQSIQQISLENLRKNIITLVDQDTVIFNISIRQNIDPLKQHTDQQILQTLNKCALKKLIKERGGLDSIISNDSISTGQKQLISICRAILKKTQIILIDQATANIDVKNDNVIQNIIKNDLSSFTVLTIAHRLSTLKNCDKIMVLDGNSKGILQFGSQKQLLALQNGTYRRMLMTQCQHFFQ